MSDVRPILTSLPGATPITAFGAALRVVASPDATSPWSPQRVEVPVAPSIDTDAIRAEACAQGRDEGMRETAALRAKLQQLIDALSAAISAASERDTQLIADAAATIVEAWTDQASAAEKFLPIVRAWQARTTEPAAARVHPSEAEELRAAIGIAAITVVADASIAVGTLQIRGPAHELTHSWEGRLSELRDAIAATLEGAE